MEGVGDVGVGVGASGEAEGVGGGVAGGVGVVVAEVVVVLAGFGVMVLAGEPERAVGRALSGAVWGVPQRVVVGWWVIWPSGVMSSVGVPMRSVMMAWNCWSYQAWSGSSLSLPVGWVWVRWVRGVKVPGSVVPGGDVAGGGVPGLGEGGAVPGEPGLFGHLSVGGHDVGVGGVAGEALLGHPAAEGVVRVAPVGAVGGADTAEVVVGVPGVGPGPGLAGQEFAVALGEAPGRSWA